MNETLEKLWNGHLKARLRGRNGGKLHKEMTVLGLRRDDEEEIRHGPPNLQRHKEEREKIFLTGIMILIIILLCFSNFISCTFSLNAAYSLYISMYGNRLFYKRRFFSSFSSQDVLH